MHILGISAYYHDAAAALLRDGQLIAAAQEERFSRRKHDPALPLRAIEFCLEQAGIKASDLDYVVFYEKPLRKFERILTTNLHYFPRSYRVFSRAMFSWLSDKLWIRTTLCKTLGVPQEKVLFTDHHQSHAASAFLCSPFDEAAVLVMDGVGEWATTTLYHGSSQGGSPLGAGRNGSPLSSSQGGSQPGSSQNGSQLTPLAEIAFPHSLGLLYSAFTAWLGFEVNDGEYKVMGMAPYGEPRYLEEVGKLIQRRPDGAYTLDLDYFTYHYHPEKSFSDKFEALFGPPRDGQARFVTRKTGLGPGELPASDAELDRNQHYADVAASIQRVTEEVMLDISREMHRRTGSRKLCLAGGVALNSVANGRIVREGPFDEVFVQPAAGDAGGALGAALYVWHVVLGRPRSFTLDRPDWGADLSSPQVEKFLRDCRVHGERIDDEGALLDRVASMLADGKVIGWAQGRFEWGPRALGNRSILADPRHASMKDRVNRTIKFREPFRPFAPAVLAERAAEFYDLDRCGGRGDPTRFMLMTARVRDEKREAVQATTHEDGSSRVQRVEKAVNPRYHGLIERFGAITGVPVLLNTSFNLKGEPIVNTPLEAYATFQRSELDALVLDRWLLLRK